MATGWARFASVWPILSTRYALVASTHQNREWMFIPSGGRLLRHKSFSGIGQVHFSCPASHAFCFTQRLTGAALRNEMADKLWQGADLIFDLDGDHLPGVSAGFPGMLSVIQDQAYLVERF